MLREGEKGGTVHPWAGAASGSESRTALDTCHASRHTVLRVFCLPASGEPVSPGC